MAQLYTSNNSGITRSWGKDLLLMGFVGLLISSYLLVVKVCRGSYAIDQQDSFAGNIIFSIAISVFLYSLFRLMFRLLNKYFPWQSSISSRVGLQLILIVLIASFGMCLFMVIWSSMFLSESFSKEQFVSNSIIAIIVSLILNTLYEGVNLYRQLKDSQVITEQLKRKNIESHFESLKNQVSPHFLFNSLNTLLVLIDEDTLKAKEFVEKLAAYYRYTLQVSEKDTVLLQTEIELLHNFIYLLKCRFGDNLQLEIDINNDDSMLHIIPLSVQMLFENAVKHNIISKNKPLIISVFVEDNYLVVENNLQIRDSLNSSNGIGLENIRSRYKIICGKEIILIMDTEKFRVQLPLIDLKND
jgi:sensor histidine kinase YesM